MTSLVNTVLGPVPADGLGVVSIHEALLSVVPGAEHAFDITMDRAEIFDLGGEAEGLPRPRRRGDRRRHRHVPRPRRQAVRGALAGIAEQGGRVGFDTFGYETELEPLTDELQRISRQGWTEDEVNDVLPGQKPAAQSLATAQV